MPEDQVIEEEISEQEPDAEGEAGFDEFADGEYEETEDEPPDEKPGEEPEAEPEEEQEPEGQPEESPPIVDEIEKRAAELKKESEAEGGPPAEDKPGEPKGEQAAERPQAKTPPAKLTKEQVSNYLNFISDDELPDEPIIIGDDTIDLRALKEDDPESFNAIKLMAGRVAHKIIANAVQSGGLVTADEVKNLRSEMDSVRGLLAFSNEMTMKGHGDFLSVVHSEDYQNWIKDQSDSVKTLANSANTDDAVRVLSFYKESVGKKRAADFDEKASAKHTRTNKLLKGTSATKPAGPAKKAKKDDDQAAFDEFADQE